MAMNILTRICVTCLRKPDLFRIPTRNLLPEAYYCDRQWGNRLSHESFNGISARDLGLSILHTIDTNGTVSPLDYDIFANKLYELDAISTDFIENIIKKYSQTQSAVDVVDSTAHAVIRAYMDFRNYEKILDLLKQRAYTGIFLDEVSANFLLDHFVDSCNWKRAIEVVWELVLQDYFLSAPSVSPISVALALHVSQQIIQEGLTEQASEDTATDDGSDEVEYKFVRYVRNPNYDNFFDVQRPRLMLGFSLLHLAELISNRLGSIRLHSDSSNSLTTSLKSGLKLFGLAYSEQLDKLTEELSRFQTVDEFQAAGVNHVVLNKLTQAVESCSTRSDDSTVTKGEPVLPTVTQVTLAVDQLKRMSDMVSSVTTEDFFSRISTYINNEVLGNQECMHAEVASVNELYKQFENTRDRIWNEHLRSARQNAIIEETKQSLRELMDEEERLTYFRQSERIWRHAWLAPRSSKEKRWSRMKEWRQDILKQREKTEQILHDA